MAGAFALRRYWHVTPDAAATLRLRAWRVPIDSELMEGPKDEPVVTLPDEENLKHWIVHEAFQHKDGEEGDPQRAAAAEAQFTAIYGRRPSFDDMARWADSPPTPTILRGHYF